MRVVPSILTRLELFIHFYQFYFLIPFIIRKIKKNELIFKNLKF